MEYNCCTFAGTVISEVSYQENNNQTAQFTLRLKKKVKDKPRKQLFFDVPIEAVSKLGSIVNDYVKIGSQVLVTATVIRRDNELSFLADSLNVLSYPDSSAEKST